MKKFLIMLAFLSSYLAAVEINSLNDISLSSDISALTKSTVVDQSSKNGKNVKCLIRDYENLTINELKFTDIVYCYINDQLFSIQYYLSDKTDINDLQKFIEGKFGRKFVERDGDKFLMDFDSNKKSTKSISLTTDSRKSKVMFIQNLNVYKQ